MKQDFLKKVSYENLRRDIFTLCRDPFSFRTVSYTIPWHTKNSLDEVDDFLLAELSKYAQTRTIPYKIQPFRCNSTKPLHHWYASPRPEDPWYDARCLEVLIPGKTNPDEIIQLVSHKDSMSWINSPGANDNAVGTAANMELIRVLSTLSLNRTVRVLFCNEEHAPWYSLTYAKDAMARGDNLLAVMNQDSICGKSDAAVAAGIHTNVSQYSTDEGKALAEFIVRTAETYSIPIQATINHKTYVNDDDGSFIKAGYLRTVMNCGSAPYADPQYHLAGDTPERVDLTNLLLTTQLILATILELDQSGDRCFHGAPEP